MAKTYQNPVVMFDPKRWSPKAQLRFMRFNVLVNHILPGRLLHLLDASKASRDWRRKEFERQVRIKENTK